MSNYRAGERCPIDSMRAPALPVTPLVEATLGLLQDLARTKLQQSGLAWTEFSRSGSVPNIVASDVAAIDRRILESGHRYAWSASISVSERPEAYVSASGAQNDDGGFSHPTAPNEAFDANGRALRGVGDNVVRRERNMIGTARFIRSNQQVLQYLKDGVPSGTVAIIDDSGGTLTAPIIEQFAGVVCAGGTVRSHLGILTREYNIPCLMNAKITGLKNGDTIEIETSAQAKTTEDYQQNIERVGRIWLHARVEEQP